MNYDEWTQENIRIIIREDYRLFNWMIDPQSHTHRNLISKVQKLVDRYFQDKEIDVARRIESKPPGNKRWYIVHFYRLDDAQMFYLTLAEHIRTRGQTFERFTS